MHSTASPSRFRWRALVAALSAAALVGAGAAPAQADPVLIWDGSNADFDLVVTTNGQDEWLYNVEVTNLTSETQYLGFGADLRQQGVTEYFWEEQWQEFNQRGQAVVPPGETYTETFLPAWSGMTYSFFSSIDGIPQLIGEFIVEGPYLPFEVFVDEEGQAYGMGGGYQYRLAPEVSRAGETLRLETSLGADWPLAGAEVWIGQPDLEIWLELNLGRGLPGIVQDGAPPITDGLQLVGTLPVNSGEIAGSVLLPADLAPGDYQLLVGDSGLGVWPVASPVSFISGSVGLVVEEGPPRGSTEPGTAVEITPLDQFGTTPVTFTFDEVTAAGTTSVTTSTTGPAPTAFTLLGGSNAVYYELETTAEFAGLVTVCLSYDPTDLSEAQQNAIALFHYTGGVWSNITTSRSPGQVCGETDSFSPFALGIPSLQYAFEGFLAPITNGGITTALAGTVVPIRFRLGGDQGLGVIAPGSPVSGQVTCSPTATAAVTQPTQAAAPLQYAQSSQTYWYLWDIPKSWGGTCRQFVMTLDDGSVHSAVVKFEKLTLRNVIKAILRAI